MATIALSAAGMALGGSIGGSVLGLSLATIGRAAGAVIGRRIDQQLLGNGSGSVETGRIDRFRVTGAAEGTDIQQVYGRTRVAGQVIWASQFLESSATTGGGGKGSPSAPKTTTFSYSVSLAIALCEGRISRIGRIWADGTEISPNILNMRLYDGALDQLPDPKTAAVEGADNTPAYRGTAYVVLEDLALGQFGNRIPQLSFEIIRPDQTGDAAPDRITGVSLQPNAGAFALATTELTAEAGFATRTAINTNTPLGGSDFTVSMDALQAELPACRAVNLPLIWFGDDLRCDQCTVAPRLVTDAPQPAQMPWFVSGLAPAQVDTVPQLDDSPVAGSTPADAAVIQAIRDLKGRGQEVTVSPGIMMVQMAGNRLPNPYSGETGQPAGPWVGDMTLCLAPGTDASPDGTATATSQIATFMGQAAPGDFAVNGTTVQYNGLNNGGYRRFILHYAHLCVAAGGVDAFCIGTELAGLTQVRSDAGFPMVDALRALAADVRSILGPDCKISYAAHWTEYHGFTPLRTDDRIFHLDPLWADPAIDFIGLSGSVPLADWRAGDDHADAAAGSIYSLPYLRGNVAGGEYYDWTYPTPEARAAQRRVPITDAQGEPWVRRVKDLQGWWVNQHHDRIGGVRQPDRTAWVPQSKPFRLLSIGCRAVDKGANDAGRALAGFGAALPYASTGARDDLMQMQYMQAILDHYGDAAQNPTSTEYAGQMIDMSRLHLRGWDPRPYPFFPGNRAVWSDGGDYATGDWLNGRVTARSLASVVTEVCARSGQTNIDVSALYGVVRGYSVADMDTGRAALQHLMLTYGFDAVERDGMLYFISRGVQPAHNITDDDLARDPETDQSLSSVRSAGTDIAGRVQFAHIGADGDYAAIAAEVVLPDAGDQTVMRSEAPVVLTRAEGKATVARWLQEARIGRDSVQFALPPSQIGINAGDTLRLNAQGHQGTYRIDRIEEAGVRLATATRIEPQVYRTQIPADDTIDLKPYVSPIAAELLFLDLPLLTGDEIPHTPHVAAAGQPWPGSIALYGAPQDSDYALQDIINEPSTVGITQTSLAAGPVGIWDRQTGIDVALTNGTLSSGLPEALLAGANMIAIGDGSGDNWEVLQFATATPQPDGTIRLSHLLRGQAGSFGLMPDLWPAGSRLVVLNGVPDQIIYPSSARGTDRHYRFGPAKQPISAASYRYEVRAFAGIGLRPYPVVHLRSTELGGDLQVSWIRCSRIDGDIWADGDIPLGEDNEVYRVRLISAGVVRREATVDAANWSLPLAQLQSDVGGGLYQIEVAQISARFGAGLPTRVTRFL